MNDKSVFEYSLVHSIYLLNEFEKILLIDFLVKNKFVKEAEAIANSMELLQKNNTRSFD